MNYYEWFGLPVAPVVDRNGLAVKYFELQKKFHPDFFSDATEEEKEEMMEKSAMINQAFQIFSSPEKTLEYYLLFRNIITDGEKYNLDQDFLMEMMELNEEWAGMDSREALKKVDMLEQELLEPVKAYLTPGLEWKDTAVAHQALKEYYYRKKYIRRILDRMGD